MTKSQLQALINEGSIDLNPPYQRGRPAHSPSSYLPYTYPSNIEVVWPEHKQIKLLDSLWRNYYVPPVVFAVYRDDEGEEVRSCVDGKQRLTSIQKFFDGQVSLILISSVPSTAPLLPFRYYTPTGHLAGQSLQPSTNPFRYPLTVKRPRKHCTLVDNMPNKLRTSFLYTWLQRTEI